MREQLIQYVELLFAGAPNSTEIKQEILQNTLDRYDDLLSQGKAPEAAYRLAISGIGDINEIIGTMNESASARVIPQQQTEENPRYRKVRAVAIAMYICSAIPLFILGDLGFGVIGLSLTLLMVAAATYLILLSRRTGPKKSDSTPKDSRKKLVGKIVDTTSVIIYLIVSFATQAWAITWLIFAIAGCVEGLVLAILDLKEANQYEN